MSDTARRMLFWSPRILGIAVALFIGVFALDAVDEGIPALLLHSAPALFLLVVVALSWRYEWLGAAAFITLALVYAARTLHRPDWILAISGPLVLVGGLFIASWRAHSAPPGHPDSSKGGTNG